MPYVCPDCGKTAKLPNFCCGRAMVNQGSYVCKTCGRSESSEAVCCDQPMVQV